MEQEIKDIVINKAKELINKHGINNFEVSDVREVNFRPHPPTVGLKTMEWAHKHNSIYIDGDCPCDVKGCNLKLKEHKGDIVLFLKLIGKVDKAKAENMVKELVITLEENKVDGVAFVQEDKDCVFVEGDDLHEK